ncbi:hypothetical protein [Actinosynnema mirum]|uniref:Uncharacterized protein n=1 Tax=Actinosynnema mirum (strain ATCC 29888 / DSM 43827 / JCM 3225 / NBRC 14064 / NCIMB 13271 / NRRL B-12336 / IMRU 3971 / 101) TaxID=446462 RepID=C6WHF9_ACTMD|nr:hypothetical protein [Actinosynnema mirum]ACU38078.1 hypothetical protein Amir_4223 [Actinosynnema mirum DSM 43827]
MNDNPLVAAPASDDGFDGITGAAVLEPAADAVLAVQRGDWLEAGINAGAAGIDALGFVADPFGALLSSAFAWFIEHTSPLKEMLDALAGDPGVVNQNAGTWGNVSDHLAKAAEEMRRVVAADTQPWTGPAVSAYRPVAMLQADAIQGASLAASGVGAALTGAAAAVAVVRTTVRDLIAMGMSELVQWLIRAAAAAAITIGLATPAIVADGIRLVVKWANKIREWVDRIVSTIRKLSKLVDQFLKVLDKVSAALAKSMPKKVPAAAATTIAENVVVQVPKNAAVYGSNMDDQTYATRDN